MLPFPPLSYLFSHGILIALQHHCFPLLTINLFWAKLGSTFEGVCVMNIIVFILCLKSFSQKFFEPCLSQAWSGQLFSIDFTAALTFTYRANPDGKTFSRLLFGFVNIAISNENFIDKTQIENREIQRNFKTTMACQNGLHAIQPHCKIKILLSWTNIKSYYRPCSAQNLKITLFTWSLLMSSKLRLWSWLWIGQPLYISSWICS